MPLTNMWPRLNLPPRISWKSTEIHSAQTMPVLGQSMTRSLETWLERKMETIPGNIMVKKFYWTKLVMEMLGYVLVSGDLKGKP